MSAEPIITCPTCRAEIKLTESLAAPLIESTRKQYEQRLATQGAEVAKREREIKAREEQLAKEKESVDASVADKLKAEREKIAVETARRDQALKAREEQLTKEKEALEVAVAEKVKGEREKLAAEAAKREREMKAREEELARQKEALDASVAEKMKAERARIAAEEAKKAKLLLGDEMEQKNRELADLLELLKKRDEKLAEALKSFASTADSLACTDMARHLQSKA